MERFARGTSENLTVAIIKCYQHSLYAYNFLDELVNNTLLLSDRAGVLRLLANLFISLIASPRVLIVHAVGGTFGCGLSTLIIRKELYHVLQYMKWYNPNMKVFIDTTSNEIIKVGLEIDGKMDLREESHEKKKAQIVLALIEELLVKHTITLQDITEIEVNPGPGSFTGIRVGIAIANTLGTVLQIPINGKKVGELIEAIYSESK